MKTNKHGISKGKWYVGIVEDNYWEGETFGYYFEATPEAVDFIERLSVMLNDPEYRNWKFVKEFVSGHELIIMKKHDTNCYMSRVNVYVVPDFSKLIEITAHSLSIGEGVPFYKGKNLDEYEG